MIVGGGPAGLASALFLVAANPSLVERVVVFERERYPREKVCAGAVGARADRALASIGVVVDVPSAPIDALSVRVRAGTVLVREPGAGRVVRRAEFDHALATIARERGIDVRDGVRVLSVHASESARDGRGVLVRTTAGDVTADVVVGADGVGGTVRRALGLVETTHRAQALEVDTEAAPGDADRTTIAFDLSRRDLPGYTWDFPTVVDGEPRVCRGVYYLKTHAAKRPLEIETVLAEELSRRGLDPARYRRKRYAERGFQLRSGVSKGRILLVGEAAGIDPVTGEGIAQAIQYGAAAGAYLAEKLPASDFDLSDWSHHVLRSSIGRDLAVRTSVVGLAYGRHRRAVEGFLARTPELLQVGFAHFAGLPYPKRAIARSAIGAIGVLGEAALRSLSRAGDPGAQDR